MSAWILALVPIILFGVLWITTPAYLPPLLDSPVGQKMLMFAGFMMVVAVFWMRKIIRIDL
jgi:tight adherence protein B